MSKSQAAHDAALAGNETIAAEIADGCEMLVKSVKSVAERLGFSKNFLVSGVGGMFRAELFKEFFEQFLTSEIPNAVFVKSRFGPAIGALFLAFRQAGVQIDKTLIGNIKKSNFENAD